MFDSLPQPFRQHSGGVAGRLAVDPAALAALAARACRAGGGAALGRTSTLRRPGSRRLPHWPRSTPVRCWRRRAGFGGRARGIRRFGGGARPAFASAARLRECRGRRRTNDSRGVAGGGSAAAAGALARIDAGAVTSLVGPPARGRPDAAKRGVWIRAAPRLLRLVRRGLRGVRRAVETAGAPVECRRATRSGLPRAPSPRWPSRSSRFTSEVGVARRLLLRRRSHRPGPGDRIPAD